MMKHSKIPVTLLIATCVMNAKDVRAYSVTNEKDVNRCVQGKKNFDLSSQFPAPKPQNSPDMSWAFGGTALVEQALYRKLNQHVNLSEASMLAQSFSTHSDSDLKDELYGKPGVSDPIPHGIFEFEDNYLDGRGSSAATLGWIKNESPRLYQDSNLDNVTGFNADLTSYAKTMLAQKKPITQSAVQEIAKKYIAPGKVDSTVADALHAMKFVDFVHNEGQSEYLESLLGYQDNQEMVDKFLADLETENPALFHQEFDKIKLDPNYSADTNISRALKRYVQKNGVDADQLSNGLTDYVRMRGKMDAAGIDYRKGAKAQKQLKGQLEADCLRDGQVVTNKILGSLCRGISSTVDDLGMSAQMGMEMLNDGKWTKLKGESAVSGLDFAGVKSFGGKPYFILRDNKDDGQGHSGTVRIAFKNMCLVHGLNFALSPGEFGYPKSNESEIENVDSGRTFPIDH